MPERAFVTVAPSGPRLEAKRAETVSRWSNRHGKRLWQGACRSWRCPHWHGSEQVALECADFAIRRGQI